MINYYIAIYVAVYVVSSVAVHMLLHVTLWLTAAVADSVDYLMDDYNALLICQNVDVTVPHLIIKTKY